MSAPLTYFVQNPQLDQLVDTYGPQLHKMQPEDRMALLVALSSYIYTMHIGELLGEHLEYTLLAAFDDGMHPDNDASSPEFCRILKMLEGITLDDTLGLMIAICNQLKYGVQ